MGSISGLARHQTHFFKVPILRRQPAHLRLLDQYPALSETHQLPGDQIAFLAGYLAHLWLDQAWILHIFQPYFAKTSEPASFHERLVEHNLLRAQLDQQQRADLPADLAESLAAARPSNWLPFVEDEKIIGWRDHLVDQLAPDSHIHTVEVFAERLDLSTSEFERRLHSDKEMEKVLSRLPLNHLKSFQQAALEHSVELVRYYVDGQAKAATKSSQPVQQLRVSPGYGETAS